MKILAPVGMTVEAVLKALRNLCVVLLLLSITITFINVVMRYVAKAPIFWADELALVAFVAVVFLSAGSVEKQGEHLQLTVLYQFFGSKARTAGTYLRASATLVIGIYLAWVGFGAAYQNLINGNKTVALKIPTALTYSVIPIAFFTMAVVDLLLLLNTLPGKKAPPVRGRKGGSVL